MHPFFKDVGATLPLVQAPMAGAQDETLAIAVAQKGAIGSIACARLQHSEITASVKRFREHTSGPLNMNFFCHDVVPRDPLQEALWLNELRGFYNDLDLATIYPTDVALNPIDAGLADIVATLKPEIVSFHFGLPSQAIVDQIRAAGSKIIATATTLKEALYLEGQGCDAVIVQGREAGGHQGIFLPDPESEPLPLMDVLTQCASELTVPLIAAGGIADADAIRSALAAGAAGTQIGTRFLKTPESTIPPLHRSILEGDQDRETAITNVFTGRPARGFVTKLVQEVGPINPNAQTFPMAMSAVAPLRTATQGSEDFVAMWAGENWQIGQAKAAADVVDDLKSGFVTD